MANSGRRLSEPEGEGAFVTQMTLKTAVPSALELRDLLEEMAVRELRGPVQGEDEEVPGRIRDRYLVGILAPRQRAEGKPASVRQARRPARR